MYIVPIVNGIGSKEPRIRINPKVPEARPMCRLAAAGHGSGQRINQDGDVEPRRTPMHRPGQEVPVQERVQTRARAKARPVVHRQSFPPLLHSRHHLGLQAKAVTIFLRLSHSNIL